MLKLDPTGIIIQTPGFLPVDLQLELEVINVIP
jgi:hypothetical protein